jgi:hypothetical protein
MSREQLIKDFFVEHEKLVSGTEESLKSREESINKKYNKIIQDLNLPFYENVPNIDPFIQVYDKVLPDDFCDHLIKIHNNNPMFVSDGVTGSQRDSKTNVPWKVSKDLCISDDKFPFKNECQVLHSITGSYIQKYLQKMHLMYGNVDLSEGIVSLFQIQYNEKNKGRYWFHNDESVDNINGKLINRHLTYLYYLNDVQDGGETIFMNCKVKPKKGRLLIFPSTWTYIHGGSIPISNDKYILTGWYYREMKIRKNIR